MTHETNIIDSAEDTRRRERAEQIADNVIELGRMWAQYGLTLGRLALRTSARSATVAAELLENIAHEIGPDDDPERPLAA